MGPELCDSFKHVRHDRDAPQRGLECTTFRKVARYQLYPISTYILLVVNELSCVAAQKVPDLSSYAIALHGQVIIAHVAFLCHVPCRQ